jgi:calcineurin-like phosphoesterase family protein
MKTFITSDTHWGHTNIIKFCPDTRSHFTDVDHMNSEMIRMWNEIVEPDDLVYHLGDVAFCQASQATKIMNSLNGRKILIKGNHDSKLVKDAGFRGCFEEIHDYLEVNYNGQKLVMFHYPIFDHNQAGRGSIMLHGHRHGNPHNIPGRIMDVGFDSTKSMVTNIDDIVLKMQNVTHMYHHDNK